MLSETFDNFILRHTFVWMPITFSDQIIMKVQVQTGRHSNETTVDIIDKTAESRKIVLIRKPFLRYTKNLKLLA